MNASKVLSGPCQTLLLERGWDGPMLLNGRDNQGRTPLMVAVRCSSYNEKPNPKLVERLLKEGSDVYAMDPEGRSVWAYCADFTVIPNLILKYWKDPSFLNKVGECFLQELFDEDDIYTIASREDCHVLLEKMLPLLFKINFDFQKKNDHGRSFKDVLRHPLEFETQFEACLSRYQQQSLTKILPQSSSKKNSKIRL